MEFRSSLASVVPTYRLQQLVAGTKYGMADDGRAGSLTHAMLTSDGREVSKTTGRTVDPPWGRTDGPSTPLAAPLKGYAHRKTSSGCLRGRWKGGMEGGRCWYLLGAAGAERGARGLVRRPGWIVDGGERDRCGCSSFSGDGARELLCEDGESARDGCFSSACRNCARRHWHQSRRASPGCARIVTMPYRAMPLGLFLWHVLLDVLGRRAGPVCSTSMRRV